MAKALSILVAIASYGRAQDHYLRRVINGLRELSPQPRIVVLTNEKKPVEGADLRVGLPSRNTYSLPFAHRQLFAENVDNYDLFVYTEDDTLLTKHHIESFCRAQELLNDDEIAGFVRSETDEGGQKTVTTIHHHFRWMPETISGRHGELFANLSNHHSGCFVVTQRQLRHALRTGKFLVAPHAGQYGMLETAASDIYTQCGLRRLLCVSRIDEFIVPHLANKYFGRFGLPKPQFDAQLRILREMANSRSWSGSLLNVETRLGGFRFSTNLYEGADEGVLQALPAGTRSVLSVGAASGGIEGAMRTRGIDVCAVPVDGVFGGALRERGIETAEGPLPAAVKSLASRRFDVVLLNNILHLVPQPIDWLSSLKGCLEQHGVLVAKVERTSNLLTWLSDLRQRHRRAFRFRYEEAGVQWVNSRRLRRWCDASGLRVLDIAHVNTREWPLNNTPATNLLRRLSAEHMLLKAAPRD